MGKSLETTRGMGNVVAHWLAPSAISDGKKKSIGLRSVVGTATARCNRLVKVYEVDRTVLQDE